MGGFIVNNDSINKSIKRKKRKINSLPNSLATVPCRASQVLAAVGLQRMRSVGYHVAVGELLGLQSGGTGSDGAEHGPREAPATAQIQKAEAAGAEGRVEERQEAVVGDGRASGQVEMLQTGRRFVNIRRHPLVFRLPANVFNLAGFGALAAKLSASRTGAEAASKPLHADVRQEAASAQIQVIQLSASVQGGKPGME